MSIPTSTSEYLLLFRGVDWDKGLSPEQIQQVMSQVMAWFDGLNRQGKVKGGHPLGEEGRTISGQNGRTVADGPFPESKEAIGGYLLLQANDLNEATAIAKTFPKLDYGTTVEVRPVAEECPVFQRARLQLIQGTA